MEPGIDVVEALAYALGVPVCWLAFGQLGAEPFRGKRPSSEPVAPIPAPSPVLLSALSALNCRVSNLGAHET